MKVNHSVLDLLFFHFVCARVDNWHDQNAPCSVRQSARTIDYTGEDRTCGMAMRRRELRTDRNRPDRRVTVGFGRFPVSIFGKSYRFGRYQSFIGSARSVEKRIGSVRFGQSTIFLSILW